MTGFGVSLTGSTTAATGAAAAAILAERRRHEMIAERQADRIFQVTSLSNVFSILSSLYTTPLSYHGIIVPNTKTIDSFMKFQDHWIQFNNLRGSKCTFLKLYSFS